ncbi:MAG: cytochrome b/b6 domain-containing protein [Anaerolineae bacterium]|jgi:cytochrome b subunit of formate dehydrogenase|nr:cytochrome b/b6 domain-containing protein [Anaerolineae bacterium]
MATQQATNDHAQGKYYNRFTIAQRVEHFVLLLSFTTLVVTGLPQKFVGNSFAEWMIAAMGGIETVRIIHRIAAVLIVLQSVYHIIVLGYKTWVRRTEMSMLPGLKDLTDALDLVRYNLGLAKEHPRMPRYNFGEKVEYWAMVWGTVIMAITGFMLWNPIATARFLPGQIIPAAKAAHGGEAILAALAILVWHFYNVHIKLLNKSIFNGKMSRHQMEEEHGAELEEIYSGQKRPAPDPAGVRRRERIYLPIAVVLAIIGAVVVFQFATFEQTAIATLPEPVESVPAFVPLTPTPGPSLTQVAASLIPHPIEGQEQCETCHGANGMKPWPADHEGRPNESCTVCHLPGPTPEPGATTESGGAAGGAAPIPHPIEGDQYQDCTACHGIDKMKPFPENHTAFPVDSCTGCHKPAEGGPPAEGGTPEAGSTPGAAGTDTAGGESAGPSAIPHPIEGDQYQDCTACHGIGKLKPFPENHTAFPVDSCTGCHQPAEGGSDSGSGSSGSGTAAAAAIPANHDLTSDAFKDCIVCHGIDRLRPFPENHTSFTVDQCTTCHQQAR